MLNFILWFLIWWIKGDHPNLAYIHSSMNLIIGSSSAFDSKNMSNEAKQMFKIVNEIDTLIEVLKPLFWISIQGIQSLMIIN